MSAENKRVELEEERRGTERRWVELDTHTHTHTHTHEQASGECDFISSGT